MDARTVGLLLLGGAGLAVVVWMLHKIGKVLGGAGCPWLSPSA